MSWSSKTEIGRRVSVSEIVGLIDGGIVVGDANRTFCRFRPLMDADSSSLTFCTPRKDMDVIGLVHQSLAPIILCESELQGYLYARPSQVFIFVKNAKYAFGCVIRGLVKFTITSSSKPDMGGGCKVADSVTFGPHVVLGDHVKIGEFSHIHPNVVIYDDVQIGHHTIIHAGCSIGHPGLGPIGSSEGWEQFPDLGMVEIGDYVQIGANCAIARSPLASTVIEDGVKIANMVNIGHNARLGKNCVITSLSMIARGHVGPGAWIAPGVTVRPGISIGEGALVGTGAVVTKNVLAHATVYGNPARRVEKK